MSAHAMNGDGRLLRGEQTRRAILARAVDVATVEGLDGLSIGQLATDLGASKSGVFAHFGSKEELQLATVDAAVEFFVERVVRPAMKAPPGVRRVWKLTDGWLEYERVAHSGGCFFFAAAAEFRSRPGRVRDRLVRVHERWAALYHEAIADAQERGEIKPDVEARQLTFELMAFVNAANATARLHDDPTAYRRARLATLARLRAVATASAPLPRRVSAPSRRS